MKIDESGSKWISRINKATEYYDDWSNKFNCNLMEEYFYGFQHSGTERRKYVINLIFSTIEIKKPTLLFQNLVFRIKPKPKSVDFNYETAIRRCQLREDTLNTIVSDPENDFETEFEMFLTDAFFRFGIMEVDYSANWIENPKAGQPILKSDSEPYADPDDSGNTIKQPEELPENERVYFKRIPAWRFRVGGVDGHSFKRCSWVGYYDFFRLADIKANKELNTEDIEWNGARSEDLVDTPTSDSEIEDEKYLKSGDYVKVWTVFDLRSKKKILILEDGSKILLEKKFSRFPLTALKFVNKLRGWYPVPLVFNWKSPQDEINEAREQQKIHRKRANRKYLYREGAFADDNELAKLESDIDMSFAKTQMDPTTVMVPLANAPLDQSVSESFIIAKDDFNIISATSADQRGQADRTTATQATLIDQKSQIRETRARVQVANVLQEIGFNALHVIQEHFTLPLWIKINTVPTDENFVEQQSEVSDEWTQITGDQLGTDLDFEVKLSMDSISPIESAQSKQNFVDFFTILTQFPQIAFSPTLVREAAHICGYRNEKSIREAMKMAQVAALGQEMQAKASLAALGGTPAGVQPNNNVADERTKQMQSPDQSEINTQIQNQLAPGTMQ